MSGVRKPMTAALPVVYDPSEDLSAPPMKVTDEECAANQIPLAERDCCAHLLIELNRCMRRELRVGWRCKHERHIYEACLAKDVIRRRKITMRDELANSDNKQ